MSEVAIENVPVRERFDVDNDMKAEWCLSKIRRIRADQKRETEELERQMRFYQDQMELVKAQADDEVAFFEGMLQGYFASRVDAGFAKKAKTKVSYKLPTGELVLKHREPEYDYKTDKDKAIAFLKESGLQKYVRVKEEVAWTDLKAACNITGDGVALKETGEIIPGIKVNEREDEFVVEVK